MFKHKVNSMLSKFKTELGQQLFEQSQKCAECVYRRNELQERGDGARAEQEDKKVQVMKNNVL